MIKDVFELVNSPPRLLYFPAGLMKCASWGSSGYRATRGPETGMLLRAPSLLHVNNPLDVLPPESYTWSEVLCSSTGLESLAFEMQVGFSGSTRMHMIINAINSLRRFREIEHIDSYSKASVPGTRYIMRDNRRGRAQRDQALLCESITQGDMHPCQILLESGTKWVWLHLNDVVDDIPVEDANALSANPS